MEKPKTKSFDGETHKRAIKGEDVGSDVRSGMTADEVMKKYGVSLNTLRNILARIVHAKLLDKADVQRLLPDLVDENLFRERRKHPRYYVYIPLPVYDVGNLLEEGQVVDISEGGLRISGIHFTKGENKELLIQPRSYWNVFPFIFEAECRWSSETESGEPVAGFAFTNITESGLAQVKKIIGMLAPRE